ncbi:MAG: hypothetical protein OXT65_00600 [Alphaproteobacteria bacterium]|nr:hypothetical protein [Alphaproteobacteria bacterium]
MNRKLSACFAVAVLATAPGCGAVLDMFQRPAPPKEYEVVCTGSDTEIPADQVEYYPEGEKRFYLKGQEVLRDKTGDCFMRSAF